MLADQPPGAPHNAAWAPVHYHPAGLAPAQQSMPMLLPAPVTPGMFVYGNDVRQMMPVGINGSAWQHPNDPYGLGHAPWLLPYNQQAGQQQLLGMQPWDSHQQQAAGQMGDGHVVAGQGQLLLPPSMQQHLEPWQQENEQACYQGRGQAWQLPAGGQQDQQLARYRLLSARLPEELQQLPPLQPQSAMQRQEPVETQHPADVGNVQLQQQQQPQEQEQEQEQWPPAQALHQTQQGQWQGQTPQPAAAAAAAVAGVQQQQQQQPSLPPPPSQLVQQPPMPGATNTAHPLQQITGQAVARVATAAAARRDVQHQHRPTNAAAARRAAQGRLRATAAAAKRQVQQQLRALQQGAGICAGSTADSAAADGAAVAADAATGLVQTAEQKAEQHFRLHAADTNPFWASAIDDPEGVLGVALLQLLPADSSRSVAMAGCALEVLLTNKHLDQLRQQKAVLQLWCFKLDDSVPNRVHWPYCEGMVLRVNGTAAYPPMAKRLKSSTLQAHQADLPVDISRHAASLKAGAKQHMISVHLTGLVSGAGFVLGCRLVRKRSVQEVKDLLPPPQSLAEAVSQLQQTLAGDDDVVAATTTVSVRCAASLVPMTTPANFGVGEGLVCVDLDSYLEMTRSSQKWQCPSTRTFFTWRDLQVSAWMSAVLDTLAAAGLKEAVSTVEVAPDARWRPQGAPSDCWFDVMSPPTAQQLQDCLQQSSGGADTNDHRLNGGNGSASKDATDVQQARSSKRQRQAAEVDMVDLAADSDTEQQQQQPAPPAAAAAAPAAAAVAAAAAAGADNARTRQGRKIRIKFKAGLGSSGSSGGQEAQQQQLEQAEQRFLHPHDRQHGILRMERQSSQVEGLLEQRQRNMLRRQHQPQGCTHGREAHQQQQQRQVHWADSILLSGRQRSSDGDSHHRLQGTIEGPVSQQQQQQQQPQDCQPPPQRGPQSGQAPQKAQQQLAARPTAPDVEVIELLSDDDD